MQPILGTEFTLNPLFALGTLKLGLHPRVTALENGNIAVAWQQSNVSNNPDVFGDTDIYVRVFKPNGTPVTGAILANTEPLGAQIDPQIAATADGGFIVSWLNDVPTSSGKNDDIYFRAFTAAGAPKSEQILASADRDVPPERAHDTYHNYNANGDVLGLKDGGAIVMYNHRGEDATYAHVIGANGKSLGDAVKIFDTDDSSAMMVQLANGDVVFARSDFSNNGMVVRVSGADLVSAPKGVKAAAGPVEVQFFNGAEHDQTPGNSSMTVPGGDYMAALPGGGFIIGYNYDPDIRYDTPLDSFRIDWFGNDGQYQRSVDLPYPGTEESIEYDAGRVVVLNDGKLLVLWQIAIAYKDYDIKAQVLDANGKSLGEPIVITSQQTAEQLMIEESVLPDGRVVLVFTDQSGVAVEGVVDELHGRVLTISGGTTAPDGPTRGDDRLAGTGKGDKIDGLGGDDVILGKGGADTLKGGAGNDTLKGGVGADVLQGNAGNDRLEGGAGHDRLAGGGCKDMLIGGGGNDLLAGGGGADRLLGGNGKDKLLGGAGNDHLDGGAGADVLSGQKGADRFVFASARAANGDTITDFNRRQGDRIDLSGIDADTGTKGNQDFDLIGKAAFSQTAGELRSYKAGGNTYLAGDIDGDGSADFRIMLEGRVNLNDGDFLF